MTWMSTCTHLERPGPFLSLGDGRVVGWSRGRNRGAGGERVLWAVDAGFWLGCERSGAWVGYCARASETATRCWYALEYDRSNGLGSVRPWFGFGGSGETARSRAAKAGSLSGEDEAKLKPSQARVTARGSGTGSGGQSRTVSSTGAGIFFFCCPSSLHRPNKSEIRGIGGCLRFLFFFLFFWGGMVVQLTN